MTSELQFVKKLRRKGIRLSANGDRLHLDAPSGVLTPEVKAAVTEAKPVILDALKRYTLREGWTPAAWRDRLRYLASIGINPAQNRDFNEWAEAIDAFYVVEDDLDPAERQRRHEVIRQDLQQINQASKRRPG